MFLFKDISYEKLIDKLFKSNYSMLFHYLMMKLDIFIIIRFYNQNYFIILIRDKEGSQEEIKEQNEIIKEEEKKEFFFSYFSLKILPYKNKLLITQK